MKVINWMLGFHDYIISLIFSILLITIKNYIEEKKYETNSNVQPRVVEGDLVKSGDQLTDGTIDPKELLNSVSKSDSDTRLGESDAQEFVNSSYVFPLNIYLRLRTYY